MSIYINHATLEDLAEYLGVEINALPANSQRLLNRASEGITQVILGNMDKSNADHLEAVKLATCAQVEFWNEVSEEAAISGLVQSFKLGDLSMDMGSSTSSDPRRLSTRSLRYLNQQGLLFAGIRSRVHYVEGEI